MMILQIPSYPELQNSTHHCGENQAASLKSTSRIPTSSATTGNSSLAWGRSLGIAGMIDKLQQYVESDLNIVRDPPFFPIATYQRVDLIRRIRIVEEEVQRSSLDGNLKSAASLKQLQAEATDTELAAALDKLFNLRDRLTRSGGPASPVEIEPGLILAVEI